MAHTITEAGSPAFCLQTADQGSRWGGSLNRRADGARSRPEAGVDGPSSAGKQREAGPEMKVHGRIDEEELQERPWRDGEESRTGDNLGPVPSAAVGSFQPDPRGTQADSAPPRALPAKDTGEGGSGDTDPRPLLCSVPPAKQLSQPELPTGGVGHGNSTESPEQEAETGTQPKGAWPDPPHSRTSQDLQHGRTPIIWGPAAWGEPWRLLCAYYAQGPCTPLSLTQIRELVAHSPP